ncbi:MAG: nucleoside deaminase [Gemmatimonadaceae bacterium]
MNHDHVTREDDRRLLRRAVEMAVQGVRNGGGPFGALIVRHGEVIAEAHNRVVLDRDPTAHAEIQAIRLAATRLGTHDLSGCMLYSSCEPCPMCLGALYWAGIGRVVFACDRGEAEKAGFSDKMIYEELVLDPSSRKIEFLRLGDVGGDEAFAQWEDLEDKVRY